MTTDEKTCKELIAERLRERIKDIKELLRAKDPIEALNNLALSWEKDKGKLILSWGGPSDGFWFTPEADRVIYYYQDWYDGAELNLRNDDLKTMQELYESCLNL